MKIIIHLRHYPKPGGTSYAVSGLTLGLINQGVDASIFGEHLNPYDINLTTPEKIKHILFKKKYRNPFYISKSLIYYLHNSSKNIDLFIINGIFSPYNFSLAWLLKKNNIKYVFAPHEPYHSSRSLINTLLKKLYFLTLESYVINNAEAIQILHDCHQDCLFRSIKYKKYIVVPNGFNIENTKLPNRLSNIHSGELIKLFTLCRIDSFVKGLDLLIKALGLLKDEMDFFFTIKGPSDKDHEFLFHLAEEHGISKRISIESANYSKPAVDMISEHDIFILPSRFEGFGIAALEGMLAERPIIISDVAGISNHIKLAQCGVLCQPEVNSIVSAIQSINNQRKNWHVLGKNGRQYALENLNWDKISTKALTQYKMLL